jgi:uncharacterized protein DUF642
MQYSHVFQNGQISHLVPRIWTLLLLFGLSAFVPHFAHAQNVIQNGDFEAPPFAPSSTLTNWTVGGTGRVHSINEGATTPTHGAALNVGGDNEGTIISQTFPTTNGEVYRVDFDSGIFGQPTGSPLQLNVQVTGTGTLVNETVTPPVVGTFDPDSVVLHHYYFSFTANSSTTTIQFSDIGLGNTNADTVVDTVSVAPEENILANGNFEIGPFDTNGSVSSWTVGGSGFVVDRSDQGNAGGLHAAALSAGSDSQGNTLSQTFATSIGQIYTLDFYTGVSGVPANGANLQLDVQLLGSGTILDQTVTPPVQQTFDPTLTRFQHYQFTFAANSNMTTVKFTDVGLGNATADIMVDTVSVVAAPTALVNGDFETPPYDTLSVAGWTISGTGRVEEKMQGSTTPSHSAAFGTGGNFQNNVLSQSFPTVVGREYELDLDGAVFGQPSGTPQLQIQLLGTGAVLNRIIAPPISNTFNPSLVNFQHYQLLFTANTNSTTLQFTDLGTGNAAADPVIDTVSVTLQPPRSFSRWQTSYFTVSQRNNPSISGWSADPDKDGYANGLEYFSHTDPLAGILTTESPSLPRPSITTSGPSKFLTFTYRRLIAWPGQPEVIEVSDDLISWDATGNQVEQVGSSTPTGDGFTETVVMRLKTAITTGPIPRKFLRIRLNQ